MDSADLATGDSTLPAQKLDFADGLAACQIPSIKVDQRTERLVDAVSFTVSIVNDLLADMTPQEYGPLPLCFWVLISSHDASRSHCKSSLRFLVS